VKQIPKWCCNCKFWSCEGSELLGICAVKEAESGKLGGGLRLWANDRGCPQFVWADVRMELMEPKNIHELDKESEVNNETDPR
jgi:hypothetical protein